jgi:hypothetical protein
MKNSTLSHNLISDYLQIMKSISLTTGILSVPHGLQVQSSLSNHDVMITEYRTVVEHFSDHLEGASGLLLPSLVVKSQDLDLARLQNRGPASRDMSTTREPKQTEGRSLLQSGRRESRLKLSTRKPDFLRERSMPNVMARGRESLRAFKQTSMPNLMLTPPRKPASQRSLNGVSERTFKSDSDNLKLKRRSSLNGVSGLTSKSDSDNLKLKRRSSINGVSERISKTNSEHLKLERRSSINGVSERISKSDSDNLKLKRRSSINGVSERISQSDSEHLKLKRRSSVNGVSELTFKSDSEHLKLKRRSSIGETVTIAKFLEDDSRSRVKPCREEAADAKSTKAITCLPVHKWKVGPTTTHAATIRPVMPKKVSSKRSVSQSREIGPLSGNVTSTPSPSRALAFLGSHAALPVSSSRG